MKTMVKNLRVLTLMVVFIVTTGVTTSSAPAPQNFPDPACVSTCVALLYECIDSGARNNDRACIGVYRHCLAQCGKD
jgi:hypothetical protein